MPTKWLLGDGDLFNSFQVNEVSFKFDNFIKDQWVLIQEKTRMIEWFKVKASYKILPYILIRKTC